MKKFILITCICFFAAGLWSCTESTEDNAKITELEEQIAKLKAQLESNNKIAAVSFNADEMVLTFGDGTVMRTPIPSNIIPEIGENGNWWINGEDLGVSAKAQIPTVGSNGNWWVDGKDTGVSAKGSGDKGEQGDKGDQGVQGVGIGSTSYDPETSILTITLTDGSSYEYALSGTGDAVIGNRLDDLNGAYLLSKIHNGDLPFAEFTYDASNRMTAITYYQTQMNAPIKTADLKFVYNAAGKIETRTATYYATEPQVTDISYAYLNYYWSYDQMPSWMNEIAVSMTATQIFDTLFPNDDIYDHAGGSNQFANHTYPQNRKEMLIEKLTSQFYDTWLVRGTTIYRIKTDHSDSKYALISLSSNAQTAAYYTTKSGSAYSVYSYKSPDFYDKDESDNSLRPDGGGISGVQAIDLSKLTVMSNDGTRSAFADFEITTAYPEYFPERIIPNYSYRYKATPYTAGSAVDVITGNKVEDYAVIKPAETFDDAGGNGSYKILLRRMSTYSKGEAMGSVKVKYVYTGNDYQLNGTDADGDSYDLCYITMKDGRMDKVQIFEDGSKVDLLQFNYNTDGLLSTINLPYENATEIARFVYDQKKNPIEMQVNSSKLAGLDASYDDIFCHLGLAYRYTEYDKTQGCLVTKIKYTDGYTPLLKMSYNYSLKNFMNHTFTALSPLTQSMTMTNALKEVYWAGHGSCLMTSFSDFNGGGYPSTMKGILNLSDLSLWNESPDVPVNGSIATLYKFSFIEKK